MVYCENSFAFVHVPRTGGMSISETIAAESSRFALLYMNVGRYPPAANRHATASQLRTWITDWEEIYRFSVMRNPFEIIDSSWRMFCDWLRYLEERSAQDKITASQASDMAKLQRYRVGRDFDFFVRRHFRYLKSSEGFYRYWLCDENRRALVSEVFQLADLPTLWPEIWRKLNPDSMGPTPALRHVNHFEHAPPAVWTADLRRHVELHFIADDIARFGYTFPNHLAYE